MAAAALCALLTPAGVTAATAGAAGAVRQVGTFVPAPPPAGPHRAVPVTAGALVRYSLNWAGYAQTGKKHTYTGVESSWVVPTVSTTPPGTQYASDWVGVGGFGDSTLVQAGTSSDNIAGTAQYLAWTEVLPAAEDPLTLVVSAGDSITTLVEQTAPGTWLMEVTDDSTGMSQSRSVLYSSSGKSVEVIHEATSICTPRCTVATLATTTGATFDPGFYTSALQPTFQPFLTPAIIKKSKIASKDKFAKLYELVITNGSSAIATPSASDTDNDGFTVIDGSSSPPAPAS